MSLQVFATRIVPDLTATRNGLFKAIVPIGSIVKVLIVNGAVNGAGVTSFDIKLDGVSIAQVIQIAAGARTALTAIQKGTVLTTEAQEMSVDLTAVPAGGLHGPIWIQVVIDDSLTAAKWVDDLYFGATNVHATGGEIAAGVASFNAAQSPLALRIAALTLADTVFNSAAHTSLAHDESTYVYDLYKAILGPDRGNDVPGHDSWYVQFISQGGFHTRTTMREAFVYSTESINNRLNQLFAGSMPVGDAKYLNGVKMKDAAAPTNNQVWAYIAATSQYELVNRLCEVGVAIGDETTVITAGAAKLTFRMPFAMKLTSVRLSVNTASSAGLVTVDLKEAGATVFSTLLSIDAGEKTSVTAAAPAVISDPNLADDAEMTVDITVAGTGAKGPKIWLIGTRA